MIRSYGTQSVIKVGLTQPITREVLEKLMNSIESDVLTESVTEDSADNHQATNRQPIRRAKKELKRLRNRAGSKTLNQKVIKSKVNAVVTLAKASRPNETGPGDCSAPGRGEKENLIPLLLLAGLISTASKSKKNARSLANTKLEMEVISQCGSGGLDDYNSSRTNPARMKLEGQLGVVEYSQITIPDSVHRVDHAGGYEQMLKARNSARGHQMAWNEKKPCKSTCRNWQKTLI